MKKYLGINTSLGLLVTDMVVVTFNIFVFGIESFLFGVTSLIITAMVMTYLETGIRRKKAVMITSERSIETIRAALAQHAHGKMLLMDATHGRTGLEHTVLVALVEDQDYPGLLKTVDACDESALVIAYNVAEVHGIEQQKYLVPLLLSFVIGLAGSAVFAVATGKLLGYSLSMSIAIGLTALYGFPGTMVLSQEAAKSAGESEAEVKIIEAQILPKMIVAGFSTVSITSVLMTSLLVGLIR